MFKQSLIFISLIFISFNLNSDTTYNCSRITIHTNGSATVFIDENAVDFDDIGEFWDGTPYKLVDEKDGLGTIYVPNRNSYNTIIVDGSEMMAYPSCIDHYTEIQNNLCSKTDYNCRKNVKLNFDSLVKNIHIDGIPENCKFMFNDDWSENEIQIDGILKKDITYPNECEYLVKEILWNKLSPACTNFTESMKPGVLYVQRLSDNEATNTGKIIVSADYDQPVGDTKIIHTNYRVSISNDIVTDSNDSDCIIENNKGIYVFDLNQTHANACNVDLNKLVYLKMIAIGSDSSRCDSSDDNYICRLVAYESW